MSFFGVGAQMRGMVRFLRDESGVMTVDFVVWLPLFVSLLVIVTDASMLYMHQTQMWNVARDTVRRMTTQRVVSEYDAECWARSQLAVYTDLNYTVVQADSTPQFNTLQIEIPLVDVSTFGYFLGPVLGNDISARVIMRADPGLDQLPSGTECVTSVGAGGGGGPGGGGGGGGGNGGGPKK